RSVSSSVIGQKNICNTSPNNRASYVDARQLTPITSASHNRRDSARSITLTITKQGTKGCGGRSRMSSRSLSLSSFGKKAKNTDNLQVHRLVTQVNPSRNRQEATALPREVANPRWPSSF